MKKSSVEIQKRLNKKITEILNHLDIHDNMVNEEMVDYFTFSNFLEDKMLIINVIREGVPYSLFSLIKSLTPFEDNDWAEFLGISNKSLQRYKQDSKTFKAIQSEKIISIAEVSELGSEVFGDLERFKLWLETPNFSLGNLKPMELLKDSYGKDLVISELTRINYGILV